MSRKRLAIFASGDGSNAENIIRHFQGTNTADVALVISNRSKAGVLDRASALGVENCFIAREDWQDEDMMLALLEEYSIDWIILSGFLLLVPPYLIKKFHPRMINIHPALLPKFGGAGMYGMNVHKAVEAASEEESGITIHEVNERFDEGRVIFQAKTAINPTDTAEDIRKKVQMLEHEHFAKVIENQVVAS